MAVSILLLAAPAASSRAQAGMTFLDNGRVRVGVDLDDGAKIAFLAPSCRPALGCQSRLRSRARLPPRQPGRRHRPHQFEHGPRALHEGRSDDQPPVAVRLHPRALDHPRRERGARAEQADELPVRRIGSAARLERAARAVYAGGAHRLVTYTGRAPYTRGGLREYTSADGGQPLRAARPRRSLPPSTGRRSSTTPASESGSSTAT